MCLLGWWFVRCKNGVKYGEFGYCYFSQAEHGIRDAQESRRLDSVYKRQVITHYLTTTHTTTLLCKWVGHMELKGKETQGSLLKQNTTAHDTRGVDLGGLRISKQNKHLWSLCICILEYIH